MLLPLGKSTIGHKGSISQRVKDAECQEKKMSSNSRKAVIKAGALSSAKWQCTLLSGRESLSEVLSSEPFKESPSACM